MNEDTLDSDEEEDVISEVSFHRTIAAKGLQS